MVKPWGGGGTYFWRAGGAQLLFPLTGHMHAAAKAKLASPGAGSFQSSPFGCSSSRALPLSSVGRSRPMSTSHQRERLWTCSLSISWLLFPAARPTPISLSMFLHFFSGQFPANPPKPCTPLEVLQVRGGSAVRACYLQMQSPSHICLSFP
jgi:hypothetical protein